MLPHKQLDSIALSAGAQSRIVGNILQFPLQIAGMKAAELSRGTGVVERAWLASCSLHGASRENAARRDDGRRCCVPVRMKQFRSQSGFAIKETV
jgi:hypothetical protein